MDYKGITIKRTGHASFFVKGSKIIYFDPFQLEKVNENEKADFILITHDHYDHCSPNDVKKIIKDETVIVTVPDCMSKLSNLKVKDIKLVKPGDGLKFGSVSIGAVPAYNTNKQFHPKENEWVGFIISLDGVKIYHAGDTDLIPEMKRVDVDIALLPVSGTYVMTAEEAAKATEMLKCKIAVPMHYGSIVGSNSDAERFKKLCKCKVELL